MAAILAGERSGAGKTTVTLALLAALRSLHPTAKIQSFKVGPDYIDPMFHSRVTGRACRNLDVVLTSTGYVQSCFAKATQGVDFALVEGVMGLFDGATGRDDCASTAHIARLLDLPVILVLNCASVARSIAAIALGYKTFDPRLKLAGLVLNQVGSDRHLELLTQALTPLDLPILGVVRRQAAITIPDRHQGLVPTAELDNWQSVAHNFAELGKSAFNWTVLTPLLQAPPPSQITVSAPVPQKIPIAIAQDQAFSFYYADNLDILTQMGAELVPWSPIADAHVPPHVQGLYFGGGFPEVFAAALAANVGARASVKASIQAGMPTIGECGGLMYLCEHIIDFDQNIHEMVGILPTKAVMSKKLTLGYRQARALADSCLVKTGDRLWGHEFHRSTLSQTSALLQLMGYDSELVYPPEGWQIYQVHASYVHIHFGCQLQLVSRFLDHCKAFSLP